MNTQSAHSIQELSPNQVAALLDDRQILLIDVREPDEFASQRIPGALLAPLSTLDAGQLPGDEPRRVVFHCGSGKRSLLAARARLAAGATHAAHMTGGIGAWVAAGLPVIHIDSASGKVVTTQGRR
jgi:rhodanese-related sulfurtransferase